MEIDDIMKSVFDKICSTGSLSDIEFAGIMTLSLIDDYRNEMVSCNNGYARLLDDMERLVTFYSCMFQ